MSHSAASTIYLCRVGAPPTGITTKRNYILIEELFFSFLQKLSQFISDESCHPQRISIDALLYVCLWMIERELLIVAIYVYDRP